MSRLGKRWGEEGDEADEVRCEGRVKVSYTALLLQREGPPTALNPRPQNQLVI